MRKIKLAGLGLLALTLMLTGCADDAIDKQAEDIASQIVDVTSGVAQNAVSQVGELIEVTGEDWMNGMRGSGLSKQVSTDKALNTTVSLAVNHPLGNITVKPMATDQLKVEATLWGSQTGTDRKKLEQIFEQAEVSFVANKETLTLMIHPKGNSDINLWDWAKKEYKTSKFIVDYVIYAPQKIDHYQLHSNIGNITLTKPQGSLQLQADIGEIEVTDATILGESSILVNTGTLDMSIEALSGTASLAAKVELGDITATMEPSLAYDLEASTELGDVVGADAGVTKHNGGGPRIRLVTSVGEVIVNKE